jgi:hypothetical protein
MTTKRGIVFIVVRTALLVSGTRCTVHSYFLPFCVVRISHADKRNVVETSDALRPQSLPSRSSAFPVSAKPIIRVFRVNSWFLLRFTYGGQG